MEQAHPNGVLLIRDSLDSYGLSPSPQEVLMASWRTGTTKQYHTYLKKWLLYCKENAVDVFRPGVNQGVEFLVSLFRSGLGYSAVNTARSALSSIIILSDGSKFGEHPLVCRCLNRIYELPQESGTRICRKNLEQKFIFQIGTLNPHGINERFSFN